MTREQQDIDSDFYAGNYKELRLTIYDADGAAFDLTGSEITFALFENEPKSPAVLLRKSSVNGNDEIEILSPAANGVCVIKLDPSDTVNMRNTYRYHVNVVDVNGHEETVTTGRIRIFRSFALRWRTDSISAYLEGA